MKSPCHNQDMYGGEDMLNCPTCGKWFKTEDLKKSVPDEFLQMLGMKPDSLTY